MSADLIFLAIAVIISILAFTWLIKVVKATLSTALTIAFILLIAQLVFGVGPTDLWQGITGGFQELWQNLGQ